MMKPDSPSVGTGSEAKGTNDAATLAAYPIMQVFTLGLNWNRAMRFSARWNTLAWQKP